MNITPDSRILVVAAHPDDEVLGCGGTLAKAVSVGADVSVLFLGEGVSARFPIGSYDSDEFRIQSERRERSAIDALTILGISNFSFGSRLCCQFDQLPLLSIVKEIEAAIREFKPTILFTHNPVEVNIDHRITYLAVESACRPQKGITPAEIYAFEIVCSGGWTFSNAFKPNVFVDIEEYWNKKLKAWHCYQEESRAFPFSRSDTGLMVLAQYRGMTSGLLKAEAFKLLRQVC